MAKEFVAFSVDGMKRNKIRERIIDDEHHSIMMMRCATVVLLSCNFSYGRAIKNVLSCEKPA